MIKKSILILIALSFFSVCFAGSIQDAHKAVIARKNAVVGYTQQQDLPGTKDNAASQAVGVYNSDRYVGGSFTASGNYTCTKIGFYAHAINGSPVYNLTAYIYSNDAMGGGAEDDEPDALLETSTTTLDASTVSVDTYMEFVFTGEALTSGVKYWAVIYSDATSANNIAVRYDSTDVLNTMQSADAATWANEDNTSQLYLKIYSGG